MRRYLGEAAARGGVRNQWRPVDRDRRPRDNGGSPRRHGLGYHILGVERRTLKGAEDIARRHLAMVDGKARDRLPGRFLGQIGQDIAQPHQ